MHCWVQEENATYIYRKSTSFLLGSGSTSQGKDIVRDEEIQLDID